jgi:hypothetical protein
MPVDGDQDIVKSVRERISPPVLQFDHYRHTRRYMQEGLILHLPE